MSNMNTNGPRNVDTQSNLALRGGSGLNGFVSYNGTNQTLTRWIILTSQNCQVNVSYPSGAGGILWKSGNSPTFNRDYITSAESTNGYKLYCRGVRYNDYSYMTITANNFTYGYSAGSWVWYSNTGAFVTGFGNGTSSQSLYSFSWTSMTNNYELKHVAS